jgi:hypothetical protein
MSKRVSVYLNNEESKQLDDLCKSQGCSKSTLLKRGLSLMDPAPLVEPEPLEPCLTIIPDRNIVGEVVDGVIDQMVESVFPIKKESL